MEVNLADLSPVGNSVLLESNVKQFFFFPFSDAFITLTFTYAYEQISNL